MLIYVSLFLIIIAYTSADVVKWLPDKSFSLASNFKNHERPCSKQTVVFPEKMYETTKIDSDISISGMILPNEGSLYIDEAVITFGADPTDNCTEEGNSYFIPNSVATWAQPDVWSSSRFNKATPDAERVPCYDDIVEFSKNAEFTLVLPDRTQHIKGLKVGDISMKDSDFQRYVTFTGIPGIKDVLHLTHDFIANKFGETGIAIGTKQCKSRAGCPCQDNALDIECSAKICQVPKCFDPVQPIGHCCKICGGYLTIDVDGTFEMMEFQEKVAIIIESYGRNNLVYHIGRLPDNKVQLVVMDKEEYLGTSALVVHAVEMAIRSSNLKPQAVFSGSPLSMKGMGGKIMISMFFLVVLVMGGIYAYYYKIPEMRFPVMVGAGSRNVMSRFNRRTESIVSLTSRRGSEGHMVGSSSGTAFRNPLYDSKRGRVHVDEPLVEE